MLRILTVSLSHRVGTEGVQGRVGLLNLTGCGGSGLAAHAGRVD